jgi:4-amino-4-deoxy-L-arabinose transferase-like glycosyltransferase
MKARLFDFSALVLTVLISLLYWAGNPTVPFHPDESTQIFMSGDVETFIGETTRLYWDPSKSDDPRQVYRLLDAPLSREMIGIGRSLFNIPATPVDWNWSLGWADNFQTGALPSDNLLQIARLSVDWLYPVSLLFIYLAGKKISGPRLGLIALVMLAGNALVLLHTRRAMAESALLFGAVFSLWGVLVTSSKTWLAAIPAALAFAAKQSGAAFLFIPFLAIFVQKWKEKRQLAVQLILALILTALITFFLNPVLWSNPVPAVAASISARLDLSQRQVNEFRQAIPGLVADSLSDRLGALLANLYFSPLQFNEVGNYLEQTRQSETIYLSSPLNTLLRSLAGGGILLFLSLVGIVLTLNQLRKKGLAVGRSLVILLFSTMVVTLALLLLPFTFQRYVIPLVPLTTLLAAYPLDQLVDILWKLKWPFHHWPIHQPN